MIFPFLLVFIPVQFLTQSGKSTTNTNQTVSCSITISTLNSFTCRSRSICWLSSIQQIMILRITVTTRDPVFKSGFRSRPPNKIFTIAWPTKGSASRISSFRWNYSCTEFATACIFTSTTSIGIKISIISIFTGYDITIRPFLPFYWVNNSSQFIGNNVTATFNQASFIDCLRTYVFRRIFNIGCTKSCWSNTLPTFINIAIWNNIICCSSLCSSSSRSNKSSIIYNAINPILIINVISFISMLTIFCFNIFCIHTR